MTFFNPYALAFLLVIPIIIMLYLLKQKHEEYTVSSLHLWQEVLRDIEANAPWQKLKRSILLFLQIAAMAFLVFALSRPFLNSIGGQAENSVILLDTSLSMQAKDIKPSRFEAARQQALSYVSNLRPGTAITVISVGDSTVLEENLSKDKNTVYEKIKNLKVTNGTSNLEDASNLLQSILSQYPGSDVVFFGDRELKIPGVNVRFSDMSSASGNFAVVLLSHSFTRNGITVLSRIANFSGSDASVPVSLSVDGRVFDARNVNIKAGETANIYWNSIPINAQLLQCSIDTKDLLDADNTAYDAVNPSNNIRVMLVTGKNVFLEKVLSLINGIELFKTDQAGSEDLKGYDLYIFDGYLPQKLPADGSLMVFNPPGNAYFPIKAEVELPILEKTKHSIFKYIDDNAFSIGRSKTLSLPVWAEPVLESGKDTLIFAGNLQNRRVLVAGFDLHETDLPLKPAFPILITNALEWLTPSSIKNIEAVHPGQSIDFNLNPKAEQIRVITPSGEITNLAPPFPAAVFSRTDELGQYILEQKTPEGTSNHYFSVNTPGAVESDLFSPSSGNTEAIKAAPSTKSRVETGFNLQWLLLWIVLTILSIEWWVYTNEV